MGLLDFIPIVGPALDAASNLVSAHSASEEYKKRYQTQVADLRAAGLNPALAYGQNPGTPPPSTSLGDIGSSAVRAAQGAAGAQQAKAQANSARATAENTDAQTGLLKAQTADLIQNLQLKNQNLATDTDLKNAQAHNETQRIDVIKQQAAILAQDFEFNRRTLDDRVNLVKAALKEKGIDIDTAEINKYLAEQQKPEAEAMARFYSGVGGKYAPYLNSAKDIIGMIMNPLQMLMPHTETSAGSTSTTRFFKGGHTTTQGPTSTTRSRR